MSSKPSLTPVIVLSGVAGSGKTTAAQALSDQFSRAQMPHALIDLDWLGQISLHGRLTWDPTLVFENLSAIWPRFEARGAEALIAPMLVESAERLADFNRSIPDANVILVRIDAARSDIDQRLAQREYGDWIDRMQQMSRQHAETLDRLELERFVVRNVDKTPDELGKEIFDLLVAGDHRSLLDMAHWAHDEG